MSPTRRHLTTTLAVIALLLGAALPAFGQSAGTTGLDRAREVAAQGFETARGLAQGPAADEATGLERAAEAVAAALERGNGNGHAWGRGNAAIVLDIVIDGGSPSDLAGHGQAVREMVQAYNALRKGA